MCSVFSLTQHGWNSYLSPPLLIASQRTGASLLTQYTPDRQLLDKRDWERVTVPSGNTFFLFPVAFSFSSTVCTSYFPSPVFSSSSLHSLSLSFLPPVPCFLLLPLFVLLLTTSDLFDLQHWKPAATIKSISPVAMVIHLDTITIATQFQKAWEEVAQQESRWRCKAHSLHTRFILVD